MLEIAGDSSQIFLVTELLTEAEEIDNSFGRTVNGSLPAGQGPNQQHRLVSLHQTLNILNDSLINIIENISVQRLKNNSTQWKIFDAVTMKIVWMPD